MLQERLGPKKKAFIMESQMVTHPKPTKKDSISWTRLREKHHLGYIYLNFNL